jgi:hypothetical protein
MKKKSLQLFKRKFENKLFGAPHPPMKKENLCGINGYCCSILHTV